MFWAVGTISEKFTDIRVGYLSTRANVWLVFHGGHLRNRVARQQPSVAIAALVENSFAHSNLIELALFGSCCRCGIAAWVSTNGTTARATANPAPACFRQGYLV